jgi:hypothetical protein|eukprot:COSAG03_NODE_748_length_6004_cov_3.279255_2_plen_71_part_00
MSEAKRARTEEYVPAHSHSQSSPWASYMHSVSDRGSGDVLVPSRYDWQGTALATKVGDKIPSIELDFEFG